MTARVCERCPAELVRRANESLVRFARRRFCSHACAAGKTPGAPRVEVYRPKQRYTQEQIRAEWEHFALFKPDITPSWLAARLHVHNRTVERYVEELAS